MEKETQEGKDMRGFINQMNLLEAQVNPQAKQQNQQGQDTMFGQMLATFMKEFLDEFMEYVRFKQRIQQQKKAQQKKEQGAPGFNPVIGAGLNQGNNN